MEHSGRNKKSKLSKEKAEVRFICSKTEISEDHFSGWQAMYIEIESGRDTNLPLIYIANSPAIAQHNPNVWNSHNKA